LPSISGRAEPLARRFYRGFGLNIASDFALPGAIECGKAGASDVTILSGPAQLGAEASSDPPYRLLNGQLHLAVTGIADYVLSSPGELIVEPQPGGSAEDVSALLIATGLPMALWAREGLVLHASGVILPGSNLAIAIAGPSGSGKSFLARALLERGARLVGDDALWLRQIGGKIVASGLPGGTFDQSAARRFHPVEPLRQAEAAQLGAIVYLTGRNGTLSSAAALATLLRHRHRPRIPALLGIEAERFALSALLCAKVPMYGLAVDWRHPDGAIDRVTALATGR
jgi:hypothetical protein